MTKTLTEQWREGTLPRGGYYIKLLDGSIKQTDYDNINKTFDTEYFRYNVSVKEVLAPVPSYEKWKEISESEDQAHAHLQDEREKNMCLEESVRILSKKLAIATKALIDYANSDEWELIDSKNVYWSRKRFPYPWRIAGKALKEMEGVE